MAAAVLTPLTITRGPSRTRCIAARRLQIRGMGSSTGLTAGRLNHGKGLPDARGIPSPVPERWFLQPGWQDAKSCLDINPSDVGGLAQGCRPTFSLSMLGFKSRFEK